MRVIDIDPILAWANDPEVYEPYGVRGSELVRKLWDAPTIDAVEVVHGKWIAKYEGTYLQRRMYCSVCGKRSGIGGIKSNQLKPFCPNCGAKMDGEREGEA